MPSRLQTNGGEERPLEDEVQVLIIPQEFSACAPQTKTTVFKFISERDGSFVPLVPEVLTLVLITVNKEVEKPTLADFISAQSADVDYRSTFAPIGHRSTQLNVQSDGVLVRAFWLDGAPQLVVCASLRHCFFLLCHYLHPAGHLGERQMCESMRKELYLRHMADDVHTTVRYFYCNIQGRTHSKQKQELNLFLPEALSDYVGIDILRSYQIKSKVSSSCS